MKSDDFRCKNCGGMMRFDPKSGNLKCENCETEEELPKVFTHKRHDISDYEKRIKNKITEGKTIVQCSSCGAMVEMEPLETSKKCPYCDTNIFIYGDYKFKIADAIITNFHLPKSTLIMLISAFGGKEFIFEAYKKAIEEKYRFY